MAELLRVNNLVTQFKTESGLVKAIEKNLVSSEDRVVVLATGSGLKDIATAIKSVGEPIVVAPELDDVKRVLA